MQAQLKVMFVDDVRAFKKLMQVYPGVKLQQDIFHVVDRFSRVIDASNTLKGASWLARFAIGAGCVFGVGSSGACLAWVSSVLWCGPVGCATFLSYPSNSVNLLWFVMLHFNQCVMLSCCALLWLCCRSCPDPRGHRRHAGEAPG